MLLLRFGFKVTEMEDTFGVVVVVGGGKTLHNWIFVRYFRIMLKKLNGEDRGLNKRDLCDGLNAGRKWW